MIAEVRKEPEQQRNIGNGWHTTTLMTRRRHWGSMLYGARGAEDPAATTLFRQHVCGLRRAVSDGLKATLEGPPGIAFEPPRSSAPRRRPGAGDLEGRIRNAELADARRRPSGRHPPPRHRP